MRAAHPGERAALDSGGLERGLVTPDPDRGGDRFTGLPPIAAVGGALVLVGIAWSSRPARKPSVAAEPAAVLVPNVVARAG